MHYFDTSMLVPLIVPEATSHSVFESTARLRDAPLAVSHWTLVEFSSLVAREVRMGNWTVEAAERVRARFEALIETSFVVVLPNAQDFEAARDYLVRYETGLRAGDALHLAIARNRGAFAVHTLDKGMAKAAEVLGIRVMYLSGLPN
jgi:predicted nucleic acid-binding protein